MRACRSSRVRLSLSLPDHPAIRAATRRQETDAARTEGFPQSVRMANLACIGSRKVNGVAELHSELVRITIMKDFVDFFGVSK